MPEDPTLPETPTVALDAEAERRAAREAFRRMFPGVMVTRSLAGADQTVLATALPTIASALHGGADLSWVVVGDLLPITASMVSMSALRGRWMTVSGNPTAYPRGLLAATVALALLATALHRSSVS